MIPKRYADLFFRYRIIPINPKDSGKTNDSGSWISDLSLNEDTIELMVKVTRSRRKIENECFNTLKNQGYHPQHNFAYGTERLCLSYS